MLLIEFIIKFFKIIRRISDKILKYFTVNKVHIILVIIFTLLGAYLRVLSNLEYDWGTDDYDHIRFTEHASVYEVIAGSYGDAHPPLRNIFLYFARGISEDPLTTRMVSLIPGILLIPLTYILIVSVLNNYLAGLFAAFIIAFSKSFILLSHGTRPYMLACMLICLHLIGGHYYFNTKKSRYLLLTFLAGMLLVFDDYGSISVVLSLSIIGSLVLYNKNKIRTVIFWIVAFLINITFFLYQIYLVFKNSGYRTEKAHPTGVQLGLDQLIINFCNIFSSHYIESQSSQVVFFIIFCLGMFFLVKEKKYEIIAYGVMPLIIVIAMAQLSLYPFISGRHSVVVAYTIIVILSAAIVCLYRDWNGIGRPFIIIIFSFLLANIGGGKVNLFSPQSILDQSNIVSTGHHFDDYKLIKNYLKSKTDSNTFFMLNRHRVRRTKDNLPYDIDPTSIYESFPHIYCDLLNANAEKLSRCMMLAVKALGPTAYQKKFMIGFLRLNLNNIDGELKNKIEIIDVYQPNRKRNSYFGIFKIKNTFNIFSEAAIQKKKKKKSK